MIALSGPAGSLEALLDTPVGAPRAAMVLAHPHPQYGGTLHTKVVFRAAKALARVGYAVLRFNFRGTGASAGAFDGGSGEKDDFRAALDAMAEWYSRLPLWAGGMSFGAWVALEVGADDPRVRGLVGIAPPVDSYDFSSLRRSTKPKFFIQGEADEICPLPSMWKFYGALPEPKELAVIDAANHLFDGHVLEVADALEDLLGDYGP